MSAGVALPGFADPVSDAQSTFRAVLDAMARPGQVHHVGGGLTAPAPLDRATAAVLLTLVDNETPLWVDSAAADAREWLAFHCGAALGAGKRYRLSGPGLRMPATLAVTGLPTDFARIWQDNHLLYPRGVDVVLCADTALAALPRSVAIEEA